MDAFTTLGGVTPLVSFKPEKPEGLAQISFSRVLTLSELSDRYVIHSRYCVLGPLDQLYLFIFLFPSHLTCSFHHIARLKDRFWNPKLLFLLPLESSDSVSVDLAHSAACGHWPDVSFFRFFFLLFF